MKDRIPTYPGRVTLVPVEGQANTYDLIRADQPTQTGTPLNKSTLLKDATAELFGLTSDAVPDDAFAFLGRFNEYWWEKCSITPASVSLGEFVSSTHVKIWGTSTSTSRTIVYGTGVTLNEDKTITITGANSVTLTYSEFVSDSSYESNRSKLANKYIAYGSNITTSSTFAIADVYRLNGTPAYRSNGGYYGIIGSVATLIYISEQYTPIGYVHSSNSSQYPIEGESAGYYYRYFGKPYDNFLTKSLGIESGSYVGTDSDSKTLTLSHKPKVLFISGYNCMLAVYGQSSVSLTNRSSSSQANRFSWSNNTVTWSNSYAGSAAYDYACNASGKTYYYWSLY